MEEKTAHEADDGPATHPFSIALSPTTAMSVREGAFVRHLSYVASSCVLLRTNDDTPPPAASLCYPRLSNAIIAVRAQPCTLHIFRGRRLCRVIEFSSPISDVGGLLPGADRDAVGNAGDLLCMVVCRDGKAYALPAAEVLEKSSRDTPTAAALAAPAAFADDERSGTTGGSAALRQTRTSSSSSVGIFDDLVPTIVSSSEQQRRQSSSNASNGNSSSSGGAVSVGALGGLVVRAQDRWVAFAHLGARRIVSCSRGGGAIAAVAGIVDRASLYTIEAVAGDTAAAGRCLASLDGVDGAAPTTISLVWMRGNQETSMPADMVSVGGGEKGFPLPARVFRALFGAELALSGTPFSPQPASAPLSGGDVGGGSGSRSSSISRKPAVILVGDETGVVRWVPLHPCPGVTGGILATVDQTVVAMLPKINFQSKAIGILIVGAKGAVLSLAEAPSQRTSRKRARAATAAAAAAGSGDRMDCGSGEIGLPRLRRRVLRLPFPAASACSTPGFLVHSHAGALFASSIPDGCSEEDHEREASGEPLDATDTDGRAADFCFTNQVDLRPVRLPLPCETVYVAVAHVQTEAEVNAGQGPPSPTPRALVVSLSRRGRLVGFFAPQSVEELEGWGLDAGKGGVRVGGSAGVERRVRSQLERLSDVSRQCAGLSAESAARDREIRILRGATRLIPTLTAGARDAGGASCGRDSFGEDMRHRERMGRLDGGLSPALGHAVEMVPDVEEDSSCGWLSETTGVYKALRVKLRVRMWVLEGGHASGLPAPGEDGAGRWFVVTQMFSEAVGEDGAAGEGWSLSASAALPMGSLRHGREWSSSMSATLPSTRPVAVTCWLQFRFEGGLRRSESAGDDVVATASGGPGPAQSNGDGRIAGEAAAGVCVELGTTHFDILDWSIILPSVPGSDAAVREAAHGRGASFCGPPLVIADILERAPTSASPPGRLSEPKPASLLPKLASLPATWGTFRLRVAIQDCDVRTVLTRLVYGDSALPAAPVSNNGFAPAWGRINASTAEIGIRVAGQVAVLRASECGVVAGGTRADGSSGSCTAVEIAVTCSHAAMGPLVREALVRRVTMGALGRRGSGDRHGGATGESAARRVGRRRAVLARGDAAARLTREVHPLREAVVEASDAARALGITRMRDGPQLETGYEALALMGRVGQIYHALRCQQERGTLL